MYLTTDLVGPIIGTFIGTNKLKRYVQRNWPTISVGVDDPAYPPGSNKYVQEEVMHRYMYYQDGNIIADQDHKDMYKALGTSVEKLEEANFDGIKDAYFAFDPDEKGPFTPSIVRSIIANDDGTPKSVHLDLIDTDIQFIDLTAPSPADPPDDQYYIDLLESTLADEDYNRIEFDFDEEEAYKQVVIMLADNEAAVYDRVITSVGTVNPNSRTNGLPTGLTSRYLISYTKVAAPAPTTLLTKRLDKMLNLDGTTIQQYRAKTLTIYTVCRNAASKAFADGVIDNATDSLYVYRTERHPLASDGGSTYGYIRASGFKSLRSKGFGQLFANLMTTGFVKENVDTWKKILGVVLIALSLLLAAVSLGTQSWVLGLVAAAVSVGTAYLPIYFADQGDYAAAAYFGKVAKVVQVIGYLTAVAGILKSGIMKSITSVFNFSGGVVASMLSFLNISNYAFSFYSWYETGQTQGKLEDMQQKIADQEAELAEMPTAKQYELMVWDFQSYNWIEINEEMQQVPYMLTQGWVTEQTRKYY